MSPCTFSEWPIPLQIKVVCGAAARTQASPHCLGVPARRRSGGLCEMCVVDLGVSVRGFARMRGGRCTAARSSQQVLGLSHVLSVRVLEVGAPAPDVSHAPIDRSRYLGAGAAEAVRGEGQAGVCLLVNMEGDTRLVASTAPRIASPRGDAMGRAASGAAAASADAATAGKRAGDSFPADASWPSEGR